MAKKTSPIPAKRIRFVYDSDHTLESPVGTPLPESEADYLKNPIMRLIDPKADPATGERRQATYREYCQYEGNPERHVVIGAIVEVECPCCGKWDTAASLWGIDFMDDSEEIRDLKIGYGHDRVKDSYDEAAALALPGYLREVARDLFSEADTEHRRMMTTRGGGYWTKTTGR